MKDLISRQAVLKLLSTMPPEEAMTKAMLIQSVKQMTAPDNLVKDSQGLAKELVNDCISRRAAIRAQNSLINRFEQILRDIRETKVDDSVCGMCEYDGAYIGQSGDWCNECPGFEKDDCFKLSEACRKRWLESVGLPSAQPEKRTDKHTETHACDCISRQAAIDYFVTNVGFHDEDENPIEDSDELRKIWTEYFDGIPSAQPERKPGKWICSDDMYETAVCSCCGWDTTEPWIHIKTWYKFCPNCGADMRGEQDG